MTPPLLTLLLPLKLLLMLTTTLPLPAVIISLLLPILRQSLRSDSRRLSRFITHLAIDLCINCSGQIHLKPGQYRQGVKTLTFAAIAFAAIQRHPGWWPLL